MAARAPRSGRAAAHPSRAGPHVGAVVAGQPGLRSHHRPAALGSHPRRSPAGRQPRASRTLCRCRSCRMSATGTTDQPAVGLRPAARPRQHSKESTMPGATRAQRLSGERARLLPRPARWLVDHRLGPAAAGPPAGPSAAPALGHAARWGRRLPSCQQRDGPARRGRHPADVIQMRAVAAGPHVFFAAPCTGGRRPPAQPAASCARRTTPAERPRRHRLAQPRGHR